jgi:hypothetical protein
LRRLAGAFSDDVTAEDLGIDSMLASTPAEIGETDQVTSLTFQGETFFAKVVASHRFPAARTELKEKRAIVLTPFSPQTWRSIDMPMLKTARYYVSTTSGKLAFSSDISITTDNLLSRPLVQRFIASPLAAASLDLVIDGKRSFASFAVLGQTGLTLFLEIPITQVHRGVWHYFWRPAVAMLMFLCLVAFVLGAQKKIKNKVRSVAEVSLILIAVASFYASNAIASSNAGSAEFRLESVTGSVKYMTPWVPTWRHLTSGRTPPKDSLICVLPGGQIKLSTMGGPSSAIKTSRIQIQINQPSSFRLDDSLLRRFGLGAQSINNLPLPKGDAKTQDESNITAEQPWFSLFSEAWERLEPVLSPEVLVQLRQFFEDKTTDKKPRLEADSLKIAAKPLPLYTPSDNVIVPLRSFPALVRVRWKDVEPAAWPYKLYVWAEGGRRPQSLYRGKRPFFTFNVATPGIYLFQVTSGDGRWQSPIHRADLGLNGPLAMTMDKNQAGESSLRLNSPPDHFVIQMSTQPLSVLFRWQSFSPMDSYDLKIERHGEKLQTLSTTNTKLTIALANAGDFTWWVVGHADGNTISSQYRHMELKQESLNISHLDKLWSQDFRQTVYLDGF